MGAHPGGGGPVEVVDHDHALDQIGDDRLERPALDELRQLAVVLTHTGPSVPAVIVGVHGESGRGQRRDERSVATGVFADPVQQLHDAGYQSVNVPGEDEVAEVVRLTCLEQGVEVSNDALAPQILIEGIKLALKLPEAAQTDPAAEVVINRGEHG